MLPSVSPISRAVVVTAWVLLVSATAYADLPLTAAVAVSLPEVLQRAAADPPSVLSGIARVGAARARLAVSEAAFQPTLRTQLSGGGTLADQPYLPELRFHNSTLSARGEAELRVPAFDFGVREHTRRSALQGVLAEQAALASTRRSACLAAGELYLTVVADDEAIAAARALIERRQQQLEVIRELVAAGGPPEGGSGA